MYVCLVSDSAEIDAQKQDRLCTTREGAKKEQHSTEPNTSACMQRHTYIHQTYSIILKSQLTKACHTATHSQDFIVTTIIRIIIIIITSALVLVIYALVAICETCNPLTEV